MKQGLCELDGRSTGRPGRPGQAGRRESNIIARTKKDLDRMAIWAYLIVFHSVVHRFRRVRYDDGQDPY
jgi:hypothetical protein